MNESAKEIEEKIVALCVARGGDRPTALRYMDAFAAPVAQSCLSDREMRLLLDDYHEALARTGGRHPTDA